MRKIKLMGSEYRVSQAILNVELSVSHQLL